MINIRFLFTLALASIISACSHLPSAPDKAPEHDYVYQIGPGDELDIKVWRNPDLSVKVPVRPDGKITAPLIKDIVAVGKTPQVLGQEIEERLGTYIRDPSVSVVVTKIVGDPLSVIRVIGQAEKPGSVPYQRGMTLLDVMTAANGLTNKAGGNNAVLVRAIEGNKQYRIRLSDLLHRGDPSANIEIAPGDAIMIPESLL
ncbi:MAG: polysaccharide biosynthesis/export family protein [Lautropia sp.]|nr:polysaccharide biosynthesis/export family protein [Lautropia sp.]